MVGAPCQQAHLCIPTTVVNRLRGGFALWPVFGEFDEKAGLERNICCRWGWPVSGDLLLPLTVPQPP